jgi:hypothetical protein
MTAQDGAGETRARRAGALDIRSITAVLFAIYGLLLTGVGIASTSPEDIAKAAGININLWLGLGMLLVAVVFGAWARLRPVVVTTGEPADVSGSDKADSESPAPPA